MFLEGSCTWEVTTEDKEVFTSAWYTNSKGTCNFIAHAFSNFVNAFKCFIKKKYLNEVRIIKNDEPLTPFYNCTASFHSSRMLEHRTLKIAFFPCFSLSFSYRLRLPWRKHPSPTYLLLRLGRWILTAEQKLEQKQVIALESSFISLRRQFSRKKIRKGSAREKASKSRNLRGRRRAIRAIRGSVSTIS